MADTYRIQLLQAIGEKIANYKIPDLERNEKDGRCSFKNLKISKMSLPLVRETTNGWKTDGVDISVEGDVCLEITNTMAESIKSGTFALSLGNVIFEHDSKKGCGKEYSCKIGFIEMCITGDDASFLRPIVTLYYTHIATFLEEVVVPRVLRSLENDSLDVANIIPESLAVKKTELDKKDSGDGYPSEDKYNADHGHGMFSQPKQSESESSLNYNSAVDNTMVGSRGNCEKMDINKRSESDGILSSLKVFGSYVFGFVLSILQKGKIFEKRHGEDRIKEEIGERIYFQCIEVDTSGNCDTEI